MYNIVISISYHPSLHCYGKCYYEGILNKAEAKPRLYSITLSIMFTLTVQKREISGLYLGLNLGKISLLACSQHTRKKRTVGLHTGTHDTRHA